MGRESILMEYSKLDKRISLQHNVPAVNSIGEYVDTYTTYATVWAAIKPLVGNLRYNAKQLNSEISGKAIIRYRSDVVATDRFIYDSRYMKFIAIINPNEANEFLEIEYAEALD
jgi:SPP1 family predicted phage head-tail adaptor